MTDLSSFTTGMDTTDAPVIPGIPTVPTLADVPAVPAVPSHADTMSMLETMRTNLQAMESSFMNNPVIEALVIQLRALTEHHIFTRHYAKK